MKLIQISLFWLLLLPLVTSAQSSNIYDQTRDDFIIVLAGGAAGAVLGLSTLSFTKKPSNNYRNILTGGAIGLVAGVIYVAYRQATDVENMPLDSNSSYLSAGPDAIANLSIETHIPRDEQWLQEQMTGPLAVGMTFQF